MVDLLRLAVSHSEAGLVAGLRDSNDQDMIVARSRVCSLTNANDLYVLHDYSREYTLPLIGCPAIVDV